MLIMSLYWAFGLSAGPAWNAWIVGLIPKGEQFHFFATRGKFHEWALLFGLVFSGVALFFAKDWPEIFLGLFILAGLARIASAYFLQRHPAEENPVQFHRASDLKSFLKWIKLPKIYKHILFLGLFHLGVSIASPFFAPFLLKQMKLSYHAYTALICIPLVSRALSYHYHEKISQIMGPRRGLIANAAGIALIPIVWVLAPNIYAFIFVQLFAGWVWAGFEYSTLLYQIQGFDAADRSRVLSWTNLSLSTANVVGVTIGAAIIGHAPNESSYDHVFLLSSGLRLLPIVFIAWIATATAPDRIYKFFYRMVSVRPNRGQVSKPIIYVEEETPKSRKKTV